jgi:hypothetical protein
MIMSQATTHGRHQTNGHCNGHASQPTPSQKPSGNDGTATRPADRTEAGKFAPGNQAGKQFTAGNKIARGNPCYRRMAELRLKVLEVITPEKLVELLQSLFARAKAGDAACAKLLLQYALGKAPQAVNPDCQNLNEWDIVSAFPTSAAVMASVLDSIHPAVAADTVRAKAPPVSTLDQVMQKICEDARATPRTFEDEFKAEKAARRRRAPRV